MKKNLEFAQLPSDIHKLITDNLTDLTDVFNARLAFIDIIPLSPSVFQSDYVKIYNYIRFGNYENSLALYELATNLIEISDSTKFIQYIPKVFIFMEKWFVGRYSLKPLKQIAQEKLLDINLIIHDHIHDLRT